jgi:hypothetical protein
MPPTPTPHSFPTRLPPHVYQELRALIDSCNRHFRTDISNSDMIGALVLRSRKERRGLLDDVAGYLDVLDAWRKDGTEILPDPD